MITILFFILILSKLFHMNVILFQAQTIRKPIVNTGMYHEEGGWPKEVNYRDVEVTQRYRRRVEKDDIWAPSMRRLLSVSLKEKRK